MRLLALLCTSFALAPSVAIACGCFSPPVPESIEGDDFAVNQQAEQIIFEVEDGMVTAHVLIRYAGDPERFGWLVPVPNVPDLALSENATFALLDQLTRPQVNVRRESVCPDRAYLCERHPEPVCGDPNLHAESDGGSRPLSDAGAFNGAGGNGGGMGAPPPDVQIYAREQIGAYDTVVLGGGEADDVIRWLNDEQFIVNDTMSPYMQPYLDADMLFVASRLVPGADLDELRPLRMTFEAEAPMVPLKLTAVAAEPHLTVTAYVLGERRVAPRDQPLVGIDDTWISEDAAGRSSYPMALARAADEAGGEGFVVEYAGAVPSYRVDDAGGCCDREFDNCGLGDDFQCQCPGSEFDRTDCEEEAPGLIEAIEQLETFGRHRALTRLSVRLSPEEMTFDPVFVPSSEVPLTGRLSLVGTVASLDFCRGDVDDEEAFAAAQRRQGCAATYCGKGTCATTNAGAGCVCDAGHVARTFTDLDGQPSVTCVPRAPTVDLAAGGLDLPDVCSGVDCGTGRCVARAGFAACDCDAGMAAIVDVEGAPRCAQALEAVGGPGAGDFSDAIREVPVCNPDPGSCGQFGWLVRNQEQRNPGVDCERTRPDPQLLVIPPFPTCADRGLPPLHGAGDDDGGCSCSVGGGGEGWLALFAGVLMLGLRRRLSVRRR